MTKEKAAAKSAPKNVTKPVTEEGWDDCTLPDIEGWFKADKGAYLHAKILNVLELKDDEDKLRQVLICTLLEPCKSATMDKQPVELQAGQTIGVGVSHLLKPTLFYAANQGEFKVTFEEQRALKKGRKVWKGQLNCRGVKAAPPIPIGRSGSEEAPEDDGDWS